MAEEININVNPVESSAAGVTEKTGTNVVEAAPAVNRPKKGDDVSIRYRGLSYEMALELQTAEQDYFFWDLPVPFGEKLKIYPVNVRKYDQFMDAVSCFLLDKKQFSPNAKPEEIKKQLKMTDLEYLLSKMESPEWMMRFITLIQMIFHVENGMKCPHCGRVMSYQAYKEAATKMFQELLKEAERKKNEEIAKTEMVNNSQEEAKAENGDTTNEQVEAGDGSSETEIAEANPEEETRADEGESKKDETPTVKCPECGGDGLYESIRYGENKQTHKTELFVDGQKIDFKEFTRLKNLVLFQNLPDYRDTSYIDPQLKKDYETQKRIKGQQRGNLTATLEEKLAALKVFEGLPSYEPLYELTVRKFLIEFAKMDDYISYNLQMMGRLCGLGGGSKDPIEHWIFHEIKDVYADGGYISKDTMMERTKGVR